MNPLDHAENRAPSRNLELKARCGNLAHAAHAAVDLGAVPSGVLHQLDTYFHVPNGRLKLREISGKPGELIWYQRANSTGFRGSDYYVLPVIKFAETLAALTGALGVRGEVRKRRELYLWHNVRIHLDDVEGLGTFVEFEAVIDDRADETVSHERLATLTQALGISDADRIGVSYSDLAGL